MQLKPVTRKDIDDDFRRATLTTEEEWTYFLHW